MDEITAESFRANYLPDVPEGYTLTATMDDTTHGCVLVRITEDATGLKVFGVLFDPTDGPCAAYHTTVAVESLRPVS